MGGKKPKPEWFRTSQGIKPNSTIVLGKLILDPRTPSGPPKLATLPIESEIFTQNHTYRRQDDHGKGGKIGVFLSFLSMLGVGTDTTVDLQLSRSTLIDVENLETQVFEPTAAYVQRVLDVPENKAELAKRKIRPLYIITGVQTAYGGTIENSTSRAWSGDASVGVSPNVPGAQIGVQGGLNRSKGQSESLGKHDFTYAFKLNKITYSRKTGGLVLDQYTRGATFDYREGRLHDEESVRGRDRTGEGKREEDAGTKTGQDQLVSSPSFEVLGVNLKDAGSNEFGIEGVVADADGDEPCIVLDASHIVDGSDDDDDDDE